MNAKRAAWICFSWRHLWGIERISARNAPQCLMQKAGFNPVRQPPKDAAFPVLKEGCGLYLALLGHGRLSSHDVCVMVHFIFSSSHGWDQ